MAKVLGVGGVFFKTAELEAVKAWYARVLGFELSDYGGASFPPPPVGGSVWSPFATDSDYFAPSTAPFMVNLVVDDLDALLERVSREGVEVLDRQAMDGVGRFAWIMDPAGVKLELWEPAPEDAASEADQPDALDVSQA